MIYKKLFYSLVFFLKKKTLVGHHRSVQVTFFIWFPDNSICPLHLNELISTFQRTDYLSRVKESGKFLNSGIWKKLIFSNQLCILSNKYVEIQSLPRRNDLNERFQFYRAVTNRVTHNPIYCISLSD